MPLSERENQDLYKKLIAKGVPQQEIEKVYRDLRRRGYGEEEARRKSGAILAKLKGKRDLAEKRRTARALDLEAHRPVREQRRIWGRLLAVEEEAPADLKRRAMDWLPPIPPRLRRRINRWAYKNGLSMARMPELINDLLAVFDKRRKDYVSRKFLELLGRRRGFLASNPFEYSLIDTLDALRFASRRLLGADRPGRRMAERELAKSIEEEVKRSLSLREPFALEFFGLFADYQEMLRLSLAYVEASLKTDMKVEVSALARAVKEGYRLILQTEGIEPEQLEALFQTVKEVNLVHDKGAGVIPELTEAQNLFQSAFQNLPVFKRELYPALLKMIASFYDPEYDGEEKKARIYSFLEMKDDMVLAYAGYQARLAEMREKAQREQKERELERLEQEKREKFSFRFEGTLSTLSSLFPESGVERIEQGQFVLPYFANRVFSKHPVFQRRLPDLENVSSGDVMGLVMVVHMIVDDLIDSVDGYTLEKILAKDGLGETVADLREEWKSAFDRLFEPYLDEIRELARETSGDPRYVKIFRESLRARTIEERANLLRNRAIKNFGHLLAARDVSDVPKLYELADRLNALLAEIADSINPELIDAADPLRRKLFEDLGKTPVVDFDARAQVASPDYRPVTRQVRRYIEARYRQTAERIPQISQVVFFDVFRGIADLYTYLLNDKKSFAAQTGHQLVVAGGEEKRAWILEKEERGRESLLMLQTRLTEDFPGQFVDELTGLKNKNYFVSELPVRLEKIKAEGKRMTMLMIDIDHFKWVNDELGHQEGDGILKETAGMILDSIREGDLAVRYGGEEILVVIPADLHTGIILAERLRFTQEQNLLLKAAFTGIKVISDERKEPCGTLSIGVSDASGAKDLGEGVKKADTALYAAKRTRNSVMFVDPEKPPEIPFTSYEEYRHGSRVGEPGAVKGGTA
jgi:diguanylate cyclase (GGDEF)-like protein